MGIPAQRDGKPCSKSFPDLLKTFIPTHPSPAATLPLDGLKPNHSSHLPVQSLRPTPTYPEAKTPHTYTQTPTPKLLPGGAKRAWIQQAPPSTKHLVVPAWWGACARKA